MSDSERYFLKRRLEPFNGLEMLLSYKCSCGYEGIENVTVNVDKDIESKVTCGKCSYGHPLHLNSLQGLLRSH